MQLIMVLMLYSLNVILIHIQVSESLSSAPKWTHRLTYHGYNPHHGDSKLTIIK